MRLLAFASTFAFIIGGRLGRPHGRLQWTDFMSEATGIWVDAESAGDLEGRCKADGSGSYYITGLTLCEVGAHGRSDTSFCRGTNAQMVGYVGGTKVRSSGGYETG